MYVSLLPYLDQAAVLQVYDFNAVNGWNNQTPSNYAKLHETRIPVYICPSIMWVAQCLGGLAEGPCPI
jgi:hypothetical protein